LSSVKIYEVDKENGKILNSFDPPCFNLTSFCFDGKKFYILDGIEKKFLSTMKRQELPFQLLFLTLILLKV